MHNWFIYQLWIVNRWWFYWRAVEVDRYWFFEADIDDKSPTSLIIIIGSLHRPINDMNGRYWHVPKLNIYIDKVPSLISRGSLAQIRIDGAVGVSRVTIQYSYYHGRFCHLVLSVPYLRCRSLNERDVYARWTNIQRDGVVKTQLEAHGGGRAILD